MVAAANRTGSAVAGWRQSRDARRSNSRPSPPAAGGDARSGPTIEKRSRAQPSRPPLPPSIPSPFLASKVSGEPMKQNRPAVARQLLRDPRRPPPARSKRSTATATGAPAATRRGPPQRRTTPAAKPGSASPAGGRANPPRREIHCGVRGNASRHHRRQRRSVRRAMPSRMHSLRAAAPRPPESAETTRKHPEA